MVSYNLDSGKRKADEVSQSSKRSQREVIVWDENRKGNRFIFDAHVVFKEADNSRSVPLRIMADTGASCSVFDLAFVERNHIPWRQRKVPVRIVSASGAPIPRAGEAFTRDCSIVVKDSKVKSERIIPATTEVFGLEEGIDLILGMDWLRANTTGLSWDISDELIFHPGVGLGLSGANAQEQVAQDASGANA